MHALRVEKEAREAHLQAVEKPAIGPNDVLMKMASAILAPDVLGLVKAGKLSQAPTTLGHKVAGTIVEIGKSVTNVSAGQRARLEPNLSCGNCTYCRTDRDQLCSECGVMGFFSLYSFPKWTEYHCGGLAEYVRAPATQVDVLPDNISFDTGAKVHDLANAVRAFRHCSPLSPGCTVLITAATGAMGTSCIKVAQFFGVGRLVLVGRSQERLEALRSLTNIPCDCIGLDSLSEDWQTSRALGASVCKIAPKGVEAIIDYSPSGQDLWQVTDALNLGGSLVPVGGNWSTFPFPARITGLKCWRIIGTRNHSRSDSQTVLSLLASGQLNVDDLTTHEYKLKDVEDALTQLQSRKQPTWMIVVRP